MARGSRLAILVCAALALSACGSDSSGRETGKLEATNVAQPAGKRACGPQPKSIRSNELGKPGAKPIAEPNIRPPCGPPPEKLVITDLKDGSGRAAAPGDEVVLRYAGADYQTGEETYGSWLSHGIPIVLGARTGMIGLELGLRGMKVGGRRELIVPTSLSEGHGTIVYIIDLLKVNSG